MISNNFKRAAYAQETNVAVIVLLTLSTPDLPDTIRVCNVPVEKFTDLGDNVLGLVSNNQRYLFLPFEIELPQDDKTGAVSAKLRIDNVNRQIVQYARQSKKPINVNIQVVLSNNLDYVEMESNDFKLSNVTYDGFSVSGNLTIDYLGLEPFPCGRFTPSGFKGLF
ncbi:MAG: DUF1833 family protein [Alphaproteobacteria bacterium]|nr:DUF1833 family protein [Alphaproteobacteria bacterium]